MDKYFSQEMQRSLIWLPEHGWGYLKPDKNFTYDKKYIDKFAAYENDPKTNLLNKLRLEFVNSHIKDNWLLDFGCGAGTFIKQRGGETFGYDISDWVREWLKKSNLFFDIESTLLIENVCFWDSLEHVANPSLILDKIYGHCFVSMPVYDNGEAVLKSKHYKPNEHLWYFTIDGLISYMAQHYFKCEQHCNFEEQIGRQSIHSFVFRKIK